MFKTFSDENKKFNIKIGILIKLARVELKMSREKFGRVMNVSYQQIAKYEKGETCLTPGQIYFISKVLYKDITYFFDNYVDQNHIYNDMFLELMQSFMKIKNIEVKKRINNLVHTIVEILN